MSAQPIDQHWYISLNDRRYGPYSYAALTEAATRGVIGPDTMVWRLGWLNWHPARQVPGLIEEPEKQSAEELDAAEQGTGEQEAREADRQEAAEEEAVDGGAAGHDFEAADASEPEHAASDVAKLRAAEHPAEEQDAMSGPLKLASEFAPRRGAAHGAADLDEAWRSFFEDTPSRTPQRRRLRPDGAVPAFADRPEETHNRRFELGAAVPFSESDQEAAPEEAAADGAVLVPPQSRERLLTPRPAPRRFGTGRRVLLGIAVIVLLIAAGWGLFASGLIVVLDPHPSDRVAQSAPPPALQGTPRPPSDPGSQPALQSQPAPPEELPAAVRAAGGSLPDQVADMPAVAALRRYHPAVFERFVKRFTDSAANAPDDQLASIARSALRKSIKRLLANAPADTLLDITETYLGYMQALQFASPESCVALSDESKGALLTANLPKEFPSLFARDMAIITRIASADQGPAMTPLTADQARPYLETVFNRLRQQSVQSELLGRAKLMPSEFLPYCTLVIAFYDSVLALPQDDRVNLLRYLYAAAADPDDGG